MFEANSLNRAKRYFKNGHNGSGPIMCVIDGQNRKVVQNLTEAEEFFKYVKVDVEKLMRQLEGVEQNIKKDENYIKKFQPLLLIPEDKLQLQFPNVTYEKVQVFINMYQTSIEAKQLHIQNTIKNNPAIEPLWIMKKICE